MTILALFIQSLPLLADGKMYIAREEVPASIPYQRAAILFDDNVQTMILQSQYQIPEVGVKHSLGWVVPVPAVPEIASMDADLAGLMFARTDFLSRPKVTRISIWFWIGISFCTFGAAVLAFVLSFFKRWKSHQKGLRRFAFYSFSGVICLILITPLFASAGSKKIEGVESVESRQVGIFDVEVIRADNASAMIDWLRTYKFAHGREDEVAIQSYIDRKWCFVTAKVTTGTDLTKTESISEGLLAPLVLRFPTPGPVYPTALTATGGHSTEILIYLTSKEAFKTTSAIQCKFRGRIPASWTMQRFLSNEGVLTGLPQDPLHLSKFKATLSPAQMAKDIEFLPDPGAPPYREHVHRW